MTTLATKDGTLIVKDGRLAQDCECCSPCVCQLYESMTVAITNLRNITQPSEVYEPFLQKLVGTYLLQLTSITTIEGFGFGRCGNYLYVGPLGGGGFSCPPYCLQIWNEYNPIRSKIYTPYVMVPADSGPGFLELRINVNWPRASLPDDYCTSGTKPAFSVNGGIDMLMDSPPDQRLADITLVVS